MNSYPINPDDIFHRAISIRAAALDERPGTMDDAACKRFEESSSEEDWALMVALLLVDFGGARTQREACRIVARIPAFLKEARDEDFRPREVAAYIARQRAHQTR